VLFSMKYIPSGIKGTGKELQHFCYTNLSLRLLQFAVTASIVADLRGMSCCNLYLFGFFSIAQHCAVQVPGTTPCLYGLKNFNSDVQAISFQVAYTRLHLGL
jgi:hypothetical protein